MFKLATNYTLLNILFENGSLSIDEEIVLLATLETRNNKRIVIHVLIVDIDISSSM